MFTEYLFSVMTWSIQKCAHIQKKKVSFLAFSTTTRETSDRAPKRRIKNLHNAGTSYSSGPDYDLYFLVEKTDKQKGAYEASTLSPGAIAVMPSESFKREEPGSFLHKPLKLFYQKSLMVGRL